MQDAGAELTLQDVPIGMKLRHPREPEPAQRVPVARKRMRCDDQLVPVMESAASTKRNKSEEPTGKEEWWRFHAIKTQFILIFLNAWAEPSFLISLREITKEAVFLLV